MVRSWLQSLLVAVALVVPISVSASIGVAVEGRDAEFAARFAGALSELLADQVKLVPPQEARLRVALDVESFRRALESGDLVIGVDIPRDVARRAASSDCQCTALLAGADPERQLRLIRALLPAAGRVGVLVGAESGWVRDELSAAGIEPPLQLAFEEVGQPDDMGPALNGLLSSVDVLLAVRDGTLYNASTAKLVLLTSYRQGHPVVGPNAEFVRAGSLATTYSSGYDLVKSVASLVRDHLAGESLPPPAFPEHFSVSINEHVARAYDLVVRDPQRLKAILTGEEARP